MTAEFPPSQGPPEDWHVIGAPGEPGFATGVENEDGTGAEIPGWENAGDSLPVAFRKDPLGMVHLRGVARLVPAFNSSDDFVSYRAVIGEIFTLPPGYRPEGLLRMPVQVTRPDPAHYESGASAERPILAFLPNGRFGDFETLMQKESEGSLQWQTSGDAGKGWVLDAIPPFLAAT